MYALPPAATKPLTCLRFQGPLSQPCQEMDPKATTSPHNNKHRKLTKLQPPTTPSTRSSLSSVRIDTPSSSRSRSDGAGDWLLDTNTPADVIIGQAFDSTAILEHIQQTEYTTPPQTPTPKAPSRPPPPAPLQHAHTADDRLLHARLPPSDPHATPAAAGLGRKMDRITPPRSDSSGTKSPRQRYSDEARPESTRKKSVFSSIFNGVKGNSRRPTISTPTNPTHVTHVSIDNETGKYTVRSRLLI